MNGKQTAITITLISLLFIFFVRPSNDSLFILLLIHQVAFIAIGILYDLTKEKAELDYLTKLYNRLFIFEKLPKILRKNKKLSICIIDIDNFKEINDMYGHSIGDEVIIRIAQLLKTETRKNDLIVRWGGDEFLIIAPNLTEKFLESLNERIDKKLQELSVVYGFTITISMGIAAYLSSGDIQMAIDKADSNMYKRKKQKFGRNCEPTKA